MRVLAGKGRERRSTLRLCAALSYNRSMLAAAKDEAVFSLAASLFASENSRLGFATSTNELHRAFGFANSNTATGLDVCLYDDGSGSRSTGKERDAESGLDYFGARYYGSALGRFTSPDEFKGGFENLNGTPAFSPGPIGYADLTDPQTLNMYVYTRNNPLRYIDPDGHDIWDYLTGVGNAFSSDNLGGAGRTSGGNEDFRLGQTVGDAVATITGSIEVLGGGGEAVVTSPAALTGVGTLAPAAGVGVALHGAATVAVAGGHLVAAAVKASDAPGTSSSGQATDEHGNKLGPSGKPMIHETNSNTREGANNKALNEGSGTVEHTNPKDGKPHFHPADAQGNKKPTSVHHNYPDN